MTNTEYKKKKRDLAVPVFFKKKVFITAMLLICSGIMAVMATYAWFILSTAPEVSGVTTTVGANGSLEMALLTNETGANTSLIKADVGDSIEVVGRVAGNVTWGNLVDLADTGYGLNMLTIYPSVLNEKDGTLDRIAMLNVPHNGYDGRIKAVSSDTSAAVYRNGAFDSSNANYGVRAIGSVGGGGSREGYLSSAKSGFTASRNSAKSALQNAITANGSVLASAALKGTGGSFTVSEIKAILAMTEGVKNSLDYAMTSYKQAMIANAAASSMSDSDFASVRIGISAAKGSAFSQYAGYLPSGVTTSDLSALEGSISDAEIAVQLISALLYNAEGDPVSDETTFSQNDVSTALGKLITNVSALSFTDNEAIIESGRFPGLITAAADYAGAFQVSIAGFTLSVDTSSNEGKGKLASIDLDDLKAPESASQTSTTSQIISTFYGYVVDLAFRTNVSDSNLQLQTEAIDRVYTDGAGATRGSGSAVIYTYADGMSDTQIKSMLSSVRMVFFDPDSGKIFAKAKLGDPTIESVGKTATAGLYLIDNAGQPMPDQSTILALPLVTPQKLSALVYLDGSSLNNTSVINAENSGTMRLNLQFSSSAKLNPMVDNDLKNQSTVPNIPDKAPAVTTEAEQPEQAD